MQREPRNTFKDYYYYLHKTHIMRLNQKKRRKQQYIGAAVMGAMQPIIIFFFSFIYKINSVEIKKKSSSR